MHLQLSRRVRDVPPGRVHAWWTDFHEGRTDHRFLPGERRTILRREGAEVEMEDRFLFFRERTTATVEADAVRFRGRNSFVTFDGAYRFEPDGDGTRIRLDVDLRLHRGLRWTRWVAKPLARIAIAADLRGHAREAESELRPQRRARGAAPPRG